MPTAITPEVYTSMGLNEFEFNQILKLLGREPSHTELGMFSVMWSEHCGYKYSRPVLQLFAKYKEAMEGSGLENAGVVEIEPGIGVTMKVESHNHPSAVEPYQGAATGVGGIIRDILTMGARPIAGLNSLRFGPIHDGADEPEIVERNRFLFEHVVAGIGGYGNCVGVPTVAGEVNFHRRYSGNPLVNAMCVGILKTDEITTAAAQGEGNPVVYLGSATGKDGIQGASFASEKLGEDSEVKRPNVQIGDPFAEKQLIEATLEALQTGAIVAIQDMGAAGLTCSTVEMAAKGQCGMIVDLDLVPMRESDMTAFELMLSESQERMLAVAAKGREQEVIDIFHKWDLQACVIGTVTDEPRLIITRQGETVADLDPRLLADHCPTYHPAQEEPAYFAAAGNFDPNSLAHPDPTQALLDLLANPDLASKRWVTRQYDSHVQTQTLLGPGEGEAAVLAPRGTTKGIAVKLDGNGRQVYLNPYFGGRAAVAEACRNVACTGAVPVALTDGLNFGSPERPHVYWQFAEAVRGIAEAAEELQTPVISGNVSFYNETDRDEVLPTPLIGALGVMENPTYRIPSAPTTSCELVLIDASPAEKVHQGLGASAYAALCGVESGYPVNPDLKREKALHTFLHDSSAKLLSAKDISEGGIAAALAEIAIGAHASVKANLNDASSLLGLSDLAALFGEIPGLVVVGVAPENLDFVTESTNRLGLGLSHLGNVTAGSSEFTIQSGSLSIETTVQLLENRHSNSISAVMSSTVK